MSELKYQYNHNKTYVVCELYEGEKVSLPNLEQVQKEYHELLLFPIQDQTKERVFGYDVSDGISLSQYIQNYIDEVDFLQLIKTIAKSILAFSQSSHLLSNVCLNPKFIFLKGMDQCNFLFLPVENQSELIATNEMIKEFICSMHIIPNSNTGAQQFLINYLNYQSVFQLPIFITVLENMSSQYAKNNFVSSSHHKTQNTFLQPPLHEEDDKKEVQIEERREEQPVETVQELLEDENATVLLKPQSSITVSLVQQSIKHAYIHRVRTKERVEITKPVFRIGKEAIYVDYYVEGNPAISRCHAMIIQRMERYYVMDTNSTNHTYVDDVMLRKNEEKEVESGSKIILANEEFYFEIV